MKIEWSYSHGVGQSQYHVVLTPYKRFKMFGRADIRMQLNRIFFSLARRHNFELKSLEIMEEHVHLFISIRPSQSIAKVMQYLKGGSSYELRKLFPELDGFHRCRLWSGGKFYRPISEVNEETIKHYIEESQTKHHHGIREPSAWLQTESMPKRTPQTTLLSFTG
ncbi:MAG: IS200/IS605 family transposase [Thermoplasmata archaeon]|nr:IS200/IS605 family transposase [Thermoplasmata archaeon]